MPSEKFFVHKEDGSLVRLKGRLVRFLDEEPPTGSDKSAIRTALEVSPDAEGLVQADIGTDPNQLVLHQHLGDISYQSSDSVSVAELEATDKIGIGTNSGTRELTIGDGTGSPNMQLLSSNSGLARIEFGDTDDGDAGELMYDHSNNKLTLNTAGSTAVTIDSSQRVGIGCSPSVDCEIDGGSSGQLKCGNGTQAVRLYADADEATILADGSVEMRFYTDGSQKMVLDTSGRLGLGTGPSSYNSEADDLVVGESGSKTSTGITVATTGGGTGTIYFADGTAGQAPYMGGIRYFHSSNQLAFSANAAEAIRILPSGNILMTGGGGIDFDSTNSTSGVTVSSSVLDHYEAGLWTPVVADAASGGNTATPGTALGRYTRVGRIVQFSCVVGNIDTTGLTAGLGLYIQGLPFPGVAVAGWKPMTVMMDTVTFSGQVVGIIAQNESAIRFKQFASGGADSDLTVSAVSSGTSDIHIQGVYEIV